MNKKAIFIPLLLLAIQPNRILSSAGNYDLAKEEIENAMKETDFRYTLNYLNYHEHIFVSDLHDDKVKELLNSCRKVMVGENWYSNKCLNIIKKHYPGIEIKTVVEELGMATKGVKR